MKKSTLRWVGVFRSISMLAFFSMLGGVKAQAVQLDWNGQFTSDVHYVSGYSLLNDNLTTKTALRDAKGYYFSGGGESAATFQLVHLKLKPKLVVNDNLYLKSELWFGNPAYAFFGSGFPTTSDQRQFYSNHSDGSVVRAQRFWMEFLTDIGVVHVGRAPLHWGLGLVWNDGDAPFSRYSTTADVIRMVSKFGSFTLSPTIAKYSMGSSVGGACLGGASCTVTKGTGTVTEYGLSLKYENLDTELEGGVQFVRRLGGGAQDTTGVLGPDNSGVGGVITNTWDLYGKKKMGPFQFGVELPIVSGKVDGMNYEAFAFASEISWTPLNSLEFELKGGYAPGQASSSGSPKKFNSFTFNPAYRFGLALFNYQPAAFSMNQFSLNGSSRSVFDNPITNAIYSQFGGKYRLEKWSFGANFAFATAAQVAEKDKTFYNSVLREFVVNNSGTSQSAFMGWEMDYNLGFKWDDHFEWGFDFGWFFPGGYYAFSNTADPLKVTSLFAGALKASINF